ncbi:MAG: Gfo/Idh/MocA family protein [Candidatus Ratteibacteria bacterium]
MKSIIVVGAGKLGKRWIEYINEEENWEIKGVIDNSEKVRDQIREKYKVPVYEDIDEINEKIDACLIVTPPETHLQISKKAILKGMNILCEKPLTLNFNEIEEIIKIVEENKVIFLVNQNQRSIPHLKVIRDFIKDGKLGRISYILIYFSRFMRTYDWREQISQPVLFDMSIYHFDDLRYVLQKELKEVKFVHTFNPNYSFYKGDACVNVIMEFFEDINVNYYATWIGKGKQTDWTGEWIIEGEMGILYLKEGKVFYIDGKEDPLNPDKIEYLPIPKEEFKDSLLWTLDKFKKALDGKFDDEVMGLTLKENIKSLKILEECLKFLSRR